jgi:hypothetical protein
VRQYLGKHTTVVLEDLGEAIQQLNHHRRRDIEMRGTHKQKPIALDEDEGHPIDVDHRWGFSALPELSLHQHTRMNQTHDATYTDKQHV